MKSRKLLWAGLLVPAFGAGSMARDVPPAFLGEAVTGAQGAVAGLPAGGAGAAAGAAGAAGKGGTLWHFLGLSHEQRHACKMRMCEKPIGQMMNNMMKPMSMMTGGLLGGFCPNKTQEEIDKMKPGAEKEAAEIKKIEAEAKARRAAIRYLATADCHWYPDVAVEIGNALRTDTVECVRLEAASAFLTGCCCNEASIKALKNVLTCEPTDGEKPETSGRVQWVAFQALNKCLACYVEKPKEKEPQKKKPVKDVPAAPAPKDGKGDTASTNGMVPYRTVAERVAAERRAKQQSFEELVAEARLAIKEYEARNPMIVNSSGAGERTIANAFARAIAPTSLQPVAVEANSTPAPQLAQSTTQPSRVVISDTIAPVKPTKDWSAPRPTETVKFGTMPPSTPVVATPAVSKPAVAVYEANDNAPKRSLYSVMFGGRSSKATETVVMESAPVKSAPVQWSSKSTSTVESTPMVAKPSVYTTPAQYATKPVPAVGLLAPKATSPAKPVIAAQSTTQPAKWQSAPAAIVEPMPISTNYSKPAQAYQPASPAVRSATPAKSAYQHVEVIESASYSEPLGAPLPQAGSNYPRGL